MTKAFMQSTDKNMQEMNRLNSQTIQELKNSTIPNSRDIQELKNSTMELKGFSQVNTQAITKMEGQIGQLANQVGERERRMFPSQPVPNPKGQFVIGNSSTSTHGQEHLQAITILRSGKQMDNQMVMPKEATGATNEKESMDKPAGDARSDTAIPITVDQPRKYVPKASYPERLMASKKSSKFDDILEVFKQMPVKYKAPRCPTIDCKIGDNRVEKALLDLGASVNLLPYSVYV
ncbi:uncharacterized protein LOC132181939 [Corylus avellana]|uniref:uncharacterized protein LOC132181939 n=1 Tax=Corylus avellana TaxID=13451 RepID=UPI00286A85A2|nr:uncharacterized protein LOC132181939 [Corylus avellana]